MAVVAGVVVVTVDLEYSFADAVVFAAGFVVDVAAIAGDFGAPVEFVDAPVLPSVAVVVAADFAVAVVVVVVDSVVEGVVVVEINRMG